MSKKKKSVDLAGVDKLITGFPGFLATQLLKRLMQRQGVGPLHLLVERRHLALAEESAKKVQEEVGFEGEVRCYGGDIVDPTLGLPTDDYKALQKSVGVVWHLAAVYDLAVGERVAYQVNVSGTRHVLDFCAGCKKLERHNYISTCFVAGDRQGMIYEHELDRGQGHNNHYESTKFWAEVEVQRRMDEIPSAIFRPAIVVGDAKTGEIPKYDGPYYLLKVIQKLPAWMPIPKMGSSESVVNIVPIDFVADALVYIGLNPEAQGNVYQLADESPMRARDIFKLSMRCLDRTPGFGTVPTKVLDTALSSARLEETLGIPRQVVQYFTHDARYDVTNTAAALQDSSIRCPHLSTYMQTLVDYFLENPDASFLDGRRV